MTAAEVGDDVYGEDPTVNRLEEKVADYLGKEAALFVPSGTMANQIAVRVHCRPGDEMLRESTSHIYLWEAGGPAVLAGSTCRTLDGTWGVLDAGTARTARSGRTTTHSVRTRLVCLENTHNRGGGTVYPLENGRRRSRRGRGSTAWRCTSTGPGSGTRSWRSGVPAREWAGTSTRSRSASARGWARRSARRWPGRRTFIAAGPVGPQALRRGDAAGGVPRRGVPLRDGSPHRPAGRGPCEREAPRRGRGERCPGSSWPRRRWKPTWSGSTSTLRSAPPRTWSARLKAKGVLGVRSGLADGPGVHAPRRVAGRLRASRGGDPGTGRVGGADTRELLH